jgi:PAS domain S-box-containing protein
MDNTMENVGYGKLLLDNFDGIMVLCSPKGIVYDCNGAFCRMLGLKRNEIIGKNATELNQAGAGLLTQKKLDIVSKTKKALSFIYKPSGLITYKTDLKPILDKNGNIGQIAVYALNVSELADIKETLTENEQNQRNILENSTNIFYSHTPDNILTYVSPQIENILGYKVEEAMHDHAKLATNDPSNENSIMFTKKAIETGLVQPPYELELRHKNGGKVWVEVRETPIVKNGKTVCIVGALTDITEQKKIKEQLNKLSVAVEQSANTIIITDKDGNIEYANPRFEKLTGYSQKEVLGQNPRILSAGTLPYAYYVRLWKMITAGEIWKGEFHNKKKNGDYFWENVTITPIKNDKGEIVNFLAVKEDITERKKAEDDLLKSRKKYKALSDHFRLMSDNIPDLVWAKNLKGEYTFVNKAICEKLLFAENTDEPIGKTDMFFVSRQRALHPNDDNWHTFGENCINSDNIVAESLKAQRFDEYGKVKGKFIYLDVYKAPILSASGEMLGTVGHGRIVTLEKEIEKALKDSEEKFRAIVENANDWIWEIDSNDSYTYSSPMSETILGYSVKEMLGKKPFDLMPEQESKIFSQIFSHYKKRNKGISKREIINIHKEGHKIVLETNASPFFDNKGKLAGYRGISRDVTLRKANELSLKSKGQRMLLAQSIGNIITWEWNAEKDEIIWSDLVYEILGTPKHEKIISYDYFLAQVHPDDRERLSKELSDAMRGRKKERSSEFRVIRNGETLWIEENSRVFFDENSVFVKMVGVMQNVTIRKKAEIALKKSEAALRKSNKTKDMFFSIIAHDLKSPFNTMLGFSNLLVNNFDRYEKEEQKKYLAIINDGIFSIYKLLENLLLWSRTQRNGIKFRPEKGNLFLLIQETFSVLKQLSENKSIKLTDQISEQISVLADKNMLQTILRNLISNAIKFTPKGGNIELAAKPFKDEQGHNYIRISVKDNGVGITKEKQEQLFKISEHISTEGTEGETGTGLGLILCKEFVEKHGGKIWVESEPDKGSKFIFILPDS